MSNPFINQVKVKVNTLLSRLTATRAGLLDNLDAAVSDTATQASLDTLDGKVVVVDTVVDGIDTKVGAVSPASSGTDTLFKYLKKIDDKNIGGIDWATKTPQGASAATASGALASVVSVSGSGYLMGISTVGNSGQVEITIDAGEATEEVITYTTGGATLSLSFTFYFAVSLDVEHNSSDGSSVRTNVSYVLD